jgi:hypothetical protein
MMPLPPGCTVPYEIQINVKTITPEIIEWFSLIGGVVREVKNYDWRGREYVSTIVKYGTAKDSYDRKDGSNNTLIRFAGADASTASMFLLKFMDQVESHNMKEYQDYVF